MLDSRFGDLLFSCSLESSEITFKALMPNGEKTMSEEGEGEGGLALGTSSNLEGDGGLCGLGVATLLANLPVFSRSRDRCDQESVFTTVGFGLLSEHSWYLSTTKPLENGLGEKAGESSAVRARI